MGPGLVMNAMSRILRDRVRGEWKPTGREATVASRWTRRVLAARPTPHGVGLLRQTRENRARIGVLDALPEATFRPG